MSESEQTRGVTSASHAALGVDVGTTNTKVVLIRVTDGSVHEERIHSLSTPASAAELRDAVLGAIRRVATDAPLPVRAIGIASMAETGALLDPDGEPLGDLLRWDAGDPAEADALVASVGAAELYAATGVPIAAKSPLVHWRSLAAAGDARLRTARWCGIADLVAVALTGSYATDRTLAARTMAYRHGGAPGADGAAAPGFDPDLLALAGLDSARFPRVLRPGEPAGTLSAQPAASLGLTPGIPVTIAGHDHAVGAWAAGARQPGDAADSVGTAEALYRVAAHVPRERARAAGFSVAPTVDGAARGGARGQPHRRRVRRVGAPHTAAVGRSPRGLRRGGRCGLRRPLAHRRPPLSPRPSGTLPGCGRDSPGRRPEPVPVPARAPTSPPTPARPWPPSSPVSCCSSPGSTPSRRPF